MPRGAQVIYPKDLAPMCMLADIGPGVTGSGERRRFRRNQHDDAPMGSRDRGYELARTSPIGPRQTLRSFLGKQRWALPRRATDCYEGSTNAASTGWCSTCPSRGGSFRMRWRRCDRVGSSSLYPIDPAGVATTGLVGLEGVEGTRSLEVRTVVGTSRSSGATGHRMVAHTVLDTASFWAERAQSYGSMKMHSPGHPRRSR